MTLGKNQPQAIHPGQGLGRFLLGVSLRDIFSYIKLHNVDEVPSIKIQSSPKSAILEPTCIFLPENGIRLRFDGPDQRLRLIEILDFRKVLLTYKGQDLVKNQDGAPVTGPSFKYVYSKLFGPTFEGEKIPGPRGSTDIQYILSYPGVAFQFNVSDWPSGADFVSILSSPATSPAVSMSIFNGSSWKDARKDLYTRSCPFPRSLDLAENPKHRIPDEMELAIIKGRGRIEFIRRSKEPWIMELGSTIAQDLILDIGRPDNYSKKNDRRLSIHKNRAINSEKISPSTPDAGGSSVDTTNTENSTTTADDDDDASTTIDRATYRDHFYNYYSNGFDIFLSTSLNFSPYLRPPFSRGPGTPGTEDDEVQQYYTEIPACTKLILWGNVPGSHFFNRHRRSRWIIDPQGLGDQGPPITSETPFSQIRERLNKIWPPGSFPPDAPSVGESQTSSKLGAKYMVLNRGWGDSPGSSIELLGSFEEEDSVVIGNIPSDKDKGKEEMAGNTQLYGWPGLLFEVRGEDVAALTVY